ncbi:hypothetical protein BH10CHL1_BH10CHL1_28710 [soil metagenome]
MKREQVQALDTTVKQVRHELAGIGSSLAMVIDEFDTLSPDFKVLFEDSWQKTCLQAIEHLNHACLHFEQTGSEVTASLMGGTMVGEEQQEDKA